MSEEPLEFDDESTEMEVTTTTGQPPVSENVRANTQKLLDRLADPNRPVQPMVVQRRQITAVTAGEIRLLVEANPTHKLAAVYLRAVEGFSNDHQLAVESADLKAILDDTDPVLDHHDEIIGGERVNVETKRSG